MKCPYCGNEIADDSVFCEYCGKKVARTKKHKPLWIALAILLVLSVIGGVAVVFEQTLVEKLLQYQQGNGDYVDLGLPSGTLWKDKNEDGGFYTYDQAVSSFGSKLPTKEQLEELNNSCTWMWRVIGYKVVGPNGNSIFLPTAGIGGDGSVYYGGSWGSYLSSSPNGSDYAWCLDFDLGKVGMNYNGRCYTCYVRLVQ